MQNRQRQKKARPAGRQGGPLDDHPFIAADRGNGTAKHRTLVSGVREEI